MRLKEIVDIFSSSPHSRVYLHFCRINLTTSFHNAMSSSLSRHEAIENSDLILYEMMSMFCSVESFWVIFGNITENNPSNISGDSSKRTINIYEPIDLFSSSSLVEYSSIYCSSSFHLPSKFLAISNTKLAIAFLIVLTCSFLRACKSYILIWSAMTPSWSFINS